MKIDYSQLSISWTLVSQSILLYLTHWWLVSDSFLGPLEQNPIAADLG